MILLYLLSAWIMADFISGIFHWVEDRYGRESWPNWAYQLVVIPNRIHHSNPSKMTKDGYWSTVNYGVLFSLPVSLLVYPFSPWLALSVILSSHANFVHRFAHTRASKLIRWVQYLGIWQSPKHHAKHHQGCHCNNYCVMTDWVNPVLEKINFWGLLERLVPVEVNQG